MVKRAIMRIDEDESNVLSAVWASLPDGYGYNIPKIGDVSNTRTGEVVARIGQVDLSTLWVVANASNTADVQTFVAAYEVKNKICFEDVSASVLYLDLNSVPDTNLQKLKRSVPPDYKVKRIFSFAGEPETYLVATTWNEKEESVAIVRLVDNRFVFEYEVNAFSAHYFENWMKGNLKVTTN